MFGQKKETKPKTTEAYLIEMLTEFLAHDFTKEPVLTVSYELCKKYAEKINKAALTSIGKEIGTG
ncbi:MAG TPA: hypothetical protein ENH82_15480 [bacterium]|nr:hypothetical protein [bacterium]